MLKRSEKRKKRLTEAIRKGGYTSRPAGNEIYDDVPTVMEKTKLALKNGLLKFLKKWGL